VRSWQVILEMEWFASILHIFFVFIQGVFETLGMTGSLGGCALLVVAIEEWESSVPAGKVLGHGKVFRIAQLLFTLLRSKQELVHDPTRVESRGEAIDDNLVAAVLLLSWLLL
jgi:hypothetical protein